MAAGTTSTTTTRTDKGGSCYYPLLCIILLICVYNALQDSHIIFSILHPLQEHLFTTEAKNNNNEILPVKLISQLHHLQHNHYHPPPSLSSLHPIIKIPSPFTSSGHSFESPVRLQRSSRVYSVYSLIQYHSQSAINHHPPHSLNSIISLHSWRSVCQR